MGQAENIDALLVKYDISQRALAKIAGVSPSGVTRWRQGAQMRPESLGAICEYFHITHDDILSDEYGLAAKEHGGAPVKCIDIPYFGAIAAGTPIDIQSADGTVPCPAPVFYRHPDSFFLKVEGTSMDKIIPDGALALIDPHDTDPVANGIYATCVNGNKATLKRVKKLANGLELIPCSTDVTQRPIVFDYNDNHDIVTIAGRMVWYMAPFDWVV